MILKETQQKIWRRRLFDDKTQGSLDHGSQREGKRISERSKLEFAGLGGAIHVRFAYEILPRSYTGRWVV